MVKGTIERQVKREENDGKFDQRMLLTKTSEEWVLQEHGKEIVPVKRDGKLFVPENSSIQDSGVRAKNTEPELKVWPPELAKSLKMRKK